MIMYDEQQAHNDFEQLVGSRQRAERLFNLYKRSYPSPSVISTEVTSRELVFRKKAKREGFTDTEIDALLNLQ